MSKAIGYFRDETSAHTSAVSLTEQNRAFLEFCKREGHDIGATFLDGDTPEQPGFRQMVEYLRQNGHGACVVVQSLQRLGRDVRQMARAYFQLDQLGVQIVALDGVACETQSLIESWRARAASERTGERVRAAMRRKAVKGEVLGRPPYGYRVGLRRRLEPVPEEAALVRHIFRLYNQEGLGIRLIARRLNEEGHRTRRDGNWSMVTIRDILRNRAYLGTYARFGVRVPGSHPAIVQQEDYRRAEERMTRRAGSSGRGTAHAAGDAQSAAGARRGAVPFLLSGLVLCGYCNNRMIGVSRRQRWRRQTDGAAVEAEYRYYQCETRTNQSMCDYHTRRAAALEEEVRALTQAELCREVAGGAGEDALDLTVSLQHLKARLRLLDRRLEQVLDAGADGQLAVADVRSLSVDVAQQQLDLEAEAEALERRGHQRHDLAERRAERERLVQTLAAEPWAALDFKLRQQTLQRLLQQVIVRDDSIRAVLRSL